MVWGLSQLMKLPGIDSPRTNMHQEEVMLLCIQHCCCLQMHCQFCGATSISVTRTDLSNKRFKQPLQRKPAHCAQHSLITSKFRRGASQCIQAVKHTTVLVTELQPVLFCHPGEVHWALLGSPAQVHWPNHFPAVLKKPTQTCFQFCTLEHLPDTGK